MYKQLSFSLLGAFCIFTLSSCGGGGSSSGSDSDSADNNDDGNDDVSVELVNGSPVTGCDEPLTELSGAFLEFVAAPNVDVVLSADGCTVTMESDGKPDHTSAYWDPNGSSGLWVEAEDTAVFGDPGQNPSGGQSSPGYIDNYVNDYDLVVSVSPQLSDNPQSTHLSSIGIAVSGTPIFNEQEGPVDLSMPVIQGLDRNGAHTGPETYHYHLEPKAVSFDDDALVGIIADGFFVYGRKCYATGDYPTDLDSANGHTGITQHTGTNPEDAVYHYHITNEPYIDNTEYYLVFGGGEFSGTESGIR